MATFYPVAWMVEQIGGARVSGTNLTPPGVEPHDVELAPQDVATLADADLVVYLKGFQPAVDDAEINRRVIEDRARDRALNKQMERREGAEVHVRRRAELDASMRQLRTADQETRTHTTPRSSAWPSAAGADQQGALESDNAQRSRVLGTGFDPADTLVA